MGDVRRGYALLLTAGDTEIAGALAEGAAKGREDSISQASPMVRALPPEQRQVVEAEMDRQRIARALRIAMHREPVDYEGMAFDAELLYGVRPYEPGALHWIGEKLLVGYALVVMGFERLFRSVGL